MRTPIKIPAVPLIRILQIRQLFFFWKITTGLNFYVITKFLCKHCKVLAACGGPVHGCLISFVLRILYWNLFCLALLGFIGVFGICISSTDESKE